VLSACPMDVNLVNGGARSDVTVDVKRAGHAGPFTPMLPAAISRTLLCRFVAEALADSVDGVVTHGTDTMEEVASSSRSCMTTRARSSSRGPPTFFDEDGGDDDVPERIRVTFSGIALRRLIRGARILGVSFGEFVRVAVKQTAYLAEKQLEGYQLVLRDPHGSDHPLPPSTMT
jgi:hypothetical protein